MLASSPRRLALAVVAVVVLAAGLAVWIWAPPAPSGNPPVVTASPTRLAVSHRPGRFSDGTPGDRGTA